MALGLLLMLLGSGGRTQAADAPGLSGEVKVGFQGNYRNAEWFGVLVQLTNDGDSDNSGTLSLSSKAELRSASREVILPGHSRKQVWLYAVSGSYNGSVQLTLQQGGDVLLQRDISLSFNDQSAFMMAVVSSDGGALNVLSGAQLGNQSSIPNVGNPSANVSSQATIAHIGLDEVPPIAAALDGLDALVIADGDTTQLSEQQRAAIRAWVISGGDLVVAGGLNGSSNAAAFGDILPVSLGAAQPISDLSPFTHVITSSEPITLSGQVVASTATLQKGGIALAAAADGNVLLAQRSYGRGRVSYIGVDPNLAALRAWGGYANLWQTLFAAHNGGPSLNSINMNSYGAGLSLLPQLDLPEPFLLFIVLFVYILVVGPLNYLLLRQLGKRELAWLTTPLITLLFAAVFYAIGYQSKGGDVLVSRTAAVLASGYGDDARVVGDLSIFSPGRSSYTLQLSDTALAMQANDSRFPVNSSVSDPPANLELGSPNLLTGLNIPTWSQGDVAIADTISLPPQFSATATGSGANLKVTVKNVSTQVYSDAVLYAPSEQYASPPFQLAAGESKDVALTKKYSRAVDLYEYMSGDTYSGLGYGVGSGGTVIYYPTTGRNRGTITDGERIQEARDQLVGTLLGSREAGLGAPDLVNSYYSGGNTNLQPSKDMQIYIVAWTDHNYLPATLTVGAKETVNVTMYVAPIASAKL